MLNLSRQFARLIKENYKAAQKFMEKPLDGFPTYSDELTEEGAKDDGKKQEYLKARYPQVKQGPSEPIFNANAATFVPKQRKPEKVEKVYVPKEESKVIE